jgi:surface polysaccharide O-acyltransferase-like enzyme
MRERKSNIELLRIISIFFIILTHVYLETNWSVPKAFNSHFFSIQLLYILGKTGVNLFFLISAYYLSTRETFKLKPLINLWITISVFSIVILLFTLVSNIEITSFYNVMKSIFPIMFNGYWFITCYFMTYLASPILNKIIKTLDFTSYSLFLMIGFIYLFVASSFFVNTSAGAGDTIIIVLYLYFVGGFLRKYDIAEMLKNKKAVLWICSLLMMICMAFSIFIVDKVQIENSLSAYSNTLITRFSATNSPFQLILSVCLFILVLNWNIPFIKWINTVSSFTLGIYILHTNYLVKYWIFNTFLGLKRFQHSPYVILILLAAALFLYLLLLLISIPLMKIVDNITKKSSDKIERQINSWVEKIKANNVIKHE